MNSAVKKIFDQVALWPDEDQRELAEFAREIEARRTGVYVLDDDERTVIAEAQKGEFANEADVAAFWKRHGIA